jgi:hypothetical protein
MLIRRDVGTAAQAARTSVLVLVLAAVAACDKVPLSAPSNSTIRVTAATRAIPADGTAEISAIVTEASGTPVQNGTSVMFTTNLGRVEPANALTMNGVATTTLHANGVSGVAQVRATSGAAGGDATTVDINIGGASASALTLTASSLTVPSAGGTVSLTAVVVDAQGNRVRGAPVSFTTTSGSLAPASVTTNENGEATVQLTTDRTTTVTARAGTTNATVTITAQSTTLALAVTPAAPTVGQLVSLAITPTIATGGAAPRVTVNWGDGTIEDVGFVSAARTVTHVYNSAGTFPVTATATTNGDATTTTTSVIVTERPAVAVNVSFAPATPAANGTVTLTANVTGAEAASVLRYEWVVSNADTGAVLQTQTTTGNQLSIIAAGNTSYIVRATAVTNDGRTGTGVTQFRVP